MEPHVLLELHVVAQPAGELLAGIERDFKSVDGFKKGIRRQGRPLFRFRLDVACRWDRVQATSNRNRIVRRPCRRIPSEAIHALEVPFDARQQFARGLAAAVGRHAVPKERVVPRLGGIVKDRPGRRMCTTISSDWPASGLFSTRPLSFLK